MQNRPVSTYDPAIVVTRRCIADSRFRSPQQLARGYAEAKRRAKVPEFSVGDFVRVKGQSPKCELDTVWWLARNCHTRLVRATAEQTALECAVMLRTSCFDKTEFTGRVRGADAVVRI